MTAELYMRPTADELAEALRRRLGAERATAYTYTNDFRVIRFDGLNGQAAGNGNSKTFRPIHRAGEVWAEGDPPGPLPLYRKLLLERSSPISRVYIGEGEKVVDILVDLGLFATTSSHGSGSAHKTDWTPLAGRDVVVLPDHGAAGGKYADDVCEQLGKLDNPPTLRVISLPGLTDGEDVEQWLASLPDDVDAVVALSELASKTKPVPRPGLDVAWFDEITEQPVDWLWDEIIPLGMPTVVAGPGKVGKSFSTLDIGAIVSTGRQWPNGSSNTLSPSRVLFLNAEDIPDKVVAGRLRKCGANRSKVGWIYGTRTAEDVHEPRLFDLESDVRHLRTYIDRYPDVRVVVIDPIGSYLPTKVNSWSDAEIRRTLAPLAALARDRNIALLLVMHLTKVPQPGSSAATSRILGSAAFSNFARSVVFVTDHPEDKELPRLQRRKLFLPDVCNVRSRDVAAMVWRITDDGIEWLETDAKFDADTLLGPEPAKARTPVREVAEWLRDWLKGGPVSADASEDEADRRGFAERTVRRARKRLNVMVSQKHRTWSLPVSKPDSRTLTTESGQTGHTGQTGQTVT